MKLKPKTKPIPMYPCGHCGALVPRYWALRHGGYCEACESMKRQDVEKTLLVSRPDVYYHGRRGHLGEITTLGGTLYNRSDVEILKERATMRKSGWLSLISTAQPLSVDKSELAQ